MRRIFNFLRIVPLIVLCLVATTAAVRVQMNETAAAAQPKLPTRIGATRAEPTYVEKIGREMNLLWMDFFAVLLPDLPPMQVAKEPKSSLSLDALKARNQPLETQLLSTVNSR